MLTTFNDDSDLLNKVLTGHESWMHSYGIETKAQLIQMEDWKKQIKFGQMWTFWSVFSSILIV